jgi:sulfide:quinone oxidoreductase
MFRDQRDAAQLQAVIDALRRGEVRHLALAVPPGATWTLPAYELALLAAADVRRLDLPTEISLVTPEPVALAAFGGEVSSTVTALLADRGVKVVCSSAPRAAERGGLRLFDGTLLDADRVVALPVLVGQRIGGLPVDHAGFVQTQARGCVVGMPDVYAAGDMTSFAVKQGGLAAQQADAIAALIALRAGGSPPLSASTLALRAQLFGAPQPLYLEATLDARGTPLAAQVSTQSPWWPGGTLFGRHVTPWMAQQALAQAAQGDRRCVAQT